MAKGATHTKQIHVYADWPELAGLHKVGVLQAEQLRGKEVFSFSYHKEWLESGFAMVLDPDLDLFAGPQYVKDGKSNFGLFMDSSPDRWGRLLMQRREALNARTRIKVKLYLMESLQQDTSSEKRMVQWTRFEAAYEQLTYMPSKSLLLQAHS